MDQVAISNVQTKVSLFSHALFAGALLVGVVRCRLPSWQQPGLNNDTGSIARNCEYHWLAP